MQGGRMAVMIAPRSKGLPSSYAMVTSTIFVILSVKPVMEPLPTVPSWLESSLLDDAAVGVVMEEVAAPLLL